MKYVYTILFSMTVTLISFGNNYNRINNYSITSLVNIVSATSDVTSGIDGGSGVVNVLNVLDNDTYNGSAASINDLVLTASIPNKEGVLILNADGSIDVAPNTPLGTYEIEYTICEKSNPTNCDSAMVTVIVDVDPSADVYIVTTVDNFNPTVDSEIVFTLIVGNNGLAIATNVVVTDYLPSGYTYKSDDSQGGYDYISGEWLVGTLGTGEQKSLSIVAKVNNQGDYSNVVTVSLLEQDPNLTNNASSNSITVCTIDCLGITDFEFNNELSLYPNPVKNQLTIEAINGSPIDKIEIHNIMGQKILSSFETMIDLSFLPKGVYIVKVETNKGIGTTKVVKE